MRVQLSKDPLFEVHESSIKAMKESQLQRQKNLRMLRMHPFVRKSTTATDIIDPLPLELKMYHQETSFRSSVEPSKASYGLKKYVIEQEKNLRCLRLERLDESPQKMGSSRLKSLTLSMTHPSQDPSSSKEIYIPEIDELFRNQAKEILLHENNSLRERLGKMILNLDDNIAKFKSLSFSYAREDEPAQKQDSVCPVGSPEEDYEIDKIIEKKLKKSQQLRDKLDKHKLQMSGVVGGAGGKASQNLGYFYLPERPKKKELLKGVKYYSYLDGRRKLQLTSASSLLFEIHKLCADRERKETQLKGLLKNSFQNRDSILNEKSAFYEQSDSFRDLSPSSQFRLRKVMNKRLNRRLEISKEQVNKFVKYLGEVKNYHLVLNDATLQVLKQVRELLLSGKVMKISDLNAIIASKPAEMFSTHPHNLIISKLGEMMI